MAMAQQYNDIIHEGFPDGGAPSLKGRLIRFRKWATKDAGITVHSAVCVVNGEATDGTRNAPVLVFEARPDPLAGGGGGGGGGKGGGGMGGLGLGGTSSGNKNGGMGTSMMMGGGGIGGGSSGGGGSGMMGGGGGGGGGGGSGVGVGAPEARCGDVDSESDRSMYDRTIGCQVRTLRDMKGDEVALSVPISAMITPDLVARSDAGRAIFACCHGSSNKDTPGVVVGDDGESFWNVFGPTGRLEHAQAERVHQNGGIQLLVKILQERKKVETALARQERIAIEADGAGAGAGGVGVGGGGEKNGVGGEHQQLASTGSISYRAPYLAFLIHQRFANEQNPPVVATTTTTTAKGARGPLPPPVLPDGVPVTFAPYVRTLPSSVCSPICWKRNELAILAGCIPGMPALQNVAARTMQLASELTALVEAGLLSRHPTVFSPGMITWDRWVWAAAVYESRVVHASSLPAWIWNDEYVVDSPSRVWESVGVMIPFVDMMNHVDDMPQARWRQSNAPEDMSARRLSFYMDERTKKHCQIYRNYGAHDNETFMLQYGFTRIGNPSDRVRIAWALVDGVGGVAPPVDYEPVSETCGVPPSHLVFDSMDPVAAKAWWTEQRIALLGRATSNSADTLESLRKGKSIRFAALNNGKIDNMLIAVAVVATASPKSVDEMFHKSANNPSSKPLDGLTLDRTGQNVVRLYLSFLFSKKLSKLLQSLNTCLRDHFDLTQLWTKASMGGLNYVAGKDENAIPADGGGGGENPSDAVGWQTFFDTYAYHSSMEVETGSYYAMAPKSCVLTLYDGHVKSLQKSLDIMATDAVFYENMKRQLEGLGCILDRTTAAAISTDVQPIVTPTSATVSEKEMDERIKPKSSGDERRAQDPSAPTKDEQGNGQGNVNKRDRDHQIKEKNKPPAIKLHIGNLSYKTQPNNLYDFFTGLYGKGSVLECHIPTERETGNSRGFGFVTMPDNHAKTALEVGRKHEMDGRILKVAESNSAGSVKGTKKDRSAPPALSSDRCSNCGYRPRWCTCNPNIPMNMVMGMGPLPLDIYGPGPYVGPPPILSGPGYGPPRDMDDRRMGGDGYGWGGGGGGSGNRRSYSRSPSYRRERDRGYRRSPSYSRSRSRSYSRGRDRGDRHHRGRHDADRRRYDDDDDRKRYDDDRRRGSSRRYRSKSRSRSRQRDIAVSPNRGRLNGETGDFSDEPEGGRSLSRSRSPIDDSGIDRPSSSKKREGKDSSGRGGGRSRSRDRGSRRRKRSSKGSRRGKESSSKRRGGSRSRSRDRH